MIFLDSDVLLDIAWKREPFYRAAAAVLALAYEDKVKAGTTPIVLSNIYYLLRGEDSDAVASGYVQKVMNILELIPIESDHFDKAMNSDFNDKEDAVNYFAALSANCEAIVTRNVRDFKNAEIPVMTPEEFMALRDSTSR